jgi:hypothetical protein
LAELGLLGRRHHAKLDESESVRLRGALEEFGPLFAGFGQYLGSRIDLLPLAACTTLAETRIPEAADQTADSAPSVARIDIEPSPIRRSFLHLWHRGVLDDEEAVIVKTVRSGAVAALEGQIEEKSSAVCDDLPPKPRPSTPWSCPDCGRSTRTGTRSPIPIPGVRFSERLMPWRPTTTRTATERGGCAHRGCNRYSSNRFSRRARCRST